jgi:hypothetical protein
MRISLSAIVNEKSSIIIECDSTEVKEALKAIKKFRKFVLKNDKLEVSEKL